MLEAINLTCVRGERRLFHDLNVHIERGSGLFVQGRNGSGKTTLLRVFAGLTPPCGGAILWNGRPIQLARDDLRRELLYCGHLIGLKDDLTATENLVYAAALADEPISDAIAQDALKQSGLYEIADLPVRALSQGQKRRVSLARLCYLRRSFWILDEPLTALDDAAAQWVLDRISRHLNEGGTAIWTSHLPVAVAGSIRTLRIGS